MTTEREILDLLDSWFRSIEKNGAPGDVAKQIAELYAEDAVLVPTVWNGPCRGRQAIQNYFEEGFLPIEPKGFLINHFMSIEGDLAVNSGHYVFNVKDCEKKPDGDCDPERTHKSARFTFVYRRDPQSNKWLIVSHHSSKMPEEHSKQALKWVKTDYISE
jgi:uncharacterized protein (TIGR02246 family)